MSKTAKETNCTRCAHRQVCKHKEDFLNVVNAINDASVSWSDGSKGCIKKVVDYDCVGCIEVSCRYCQPELAYPRGNTL